MEFSPVFCFRMADLVRRGLALLAGGMIRVLRWIIEAAQKIYEEVTATIQGYRDKLSVLATWVANLDEECPYVRDPNTGVSTRTPPSVTGDTLTRCLGLVEDVATKLSESNMEKQMSSMKEASTRSKSQVCANPSASGDNCVRTLLCTNNTCLDLLSHQSMLTFFSR